MKYYLLKCKVESRELNEENYGVLMINDDNSREYVCNISSRVDKVSLLVDNMNYYNIDGHQAKEILEDFEFGIKDIMHV